MKALNRAIEKAFLQNGEDIDELIACMGEELGCKRISIFEENKEGSCDNTYEWCAQGVKKSRILLQRIAISRFNSWHDRLAQRETISVFSAEELKAGDPDVYAMFIDQGINRALVTLLAFHGKNFGFCILEDPSDEVMEDRELIMPGIRYILSSMIYSRNLVSKLKRMGYIDSLTGAGNRMSLHEHLKRLDREKAISVICVEVIGWDDAEGEQSHLERDQALVRAGEVLTNIYDTERVFRVAAEEFMVVDSGASKEAFERGLRAIRGLFRECDLLAAVCGEWEQQLTRNIDALIDQAHEKTEEKKRSMLSRKNSVKQSREIDEADKANIDLPGGDDFIRAADRFLSKLYEERVVCVVTDINYFKLYNDIFGRKAGNSFLESIGRMIQETAKSHHGICGYMGGDNFCLIAPVDAKNNQEIMPMIEGLYQSLEFPDGFSPAMGVYLSEDRRESTTTLYDRASSALSEIKGDYIRHIHYYTDEAHRHHKEDKLLLMDVKEGLANGEFIFYVQPQVNERTGKIIGAEALVRWKHRGMLVRPDRFIPVLEKTGYVYAVDCCVWEAVAKWLRSLLDRGIAPVPISVNVSRVDFYFTDIAKHFADLVKRYGLTPELISIEITESAFTDNNDTILSAIRQLHEAGFHILMDDFGSGSSSLSMLRTMNVDVLKTDVQFMSQNAQDQRAFSIVESVISMAHLIGMSVVTEGVETEEQKNNLIAIGNNFAQGFYFYKPMPIEQFERLIKDQNNVEEGYKRKKADDEGQLRFKDMIRKGMLSDTLMDNILRAAAVLKEASGQITLLQVNGQYSYLTGLTASQGDRFEDHMEPGELLKLKKLLEDANNHPVGGSQGTIRFLKPNGSAASVEMRVFLLYTLEEQRVFMSAIG